MSQMMSHMTVDAAMDVPPDPREPMTDVQEVRLRELSEAVGEDFDAELTLREADRRIEELEDFAGKKAPAS
ncbi:pyrophosphatase [Salipiger sp. CCB-MM3]|uniref:DUF3072 domain-containing protein n=1 Tax=Roseobacteraceae TaxID=2854170 RepID=UPI00080A9E45|nr:MULTISPECIES: DUF3072 domain-containing protein [Roseobacteraceae]ANT62539.1 pyrophosphatase [Salipiger sp. CCB-MM3]MCA0996707.1 DUF3072 domain-containing protein [Alloyangia pacifica]